MLRPFRNKSSRNIPTPWVIIFIRVDAWLWELFFYFVGGGVILPIPSNVRLLNVGLSWSSVKWDFKSSPRTRTIPHYWGRLQDNFVFSQGLRLQTSKFWYLIPQGITFILMRKHTYCSIEINTIKTPVWKP